MSLFNLFRSPADRPQNVDREALLARYKQLRRVSRELNSRLAGQLSKEMIQEGGKALGILKGKTLVLDTEDESSVLMDYCIYNVRRDGRTVIETHQVSSGADSESDELICFRAMQSAIYSIFVVETVEEGLGVTVQDVQTNKTYRVIDTGFASSCRPEMVFASRLLLHDGFAMTGGAALPLGSLSPGQRDVFIESVLALMDRDDVGHFDPAILIRACLKNGVTSKIQYVEPGGRIAGRGRLPKQEPLANVDPYAPCPCGSGKKFKFCCRNTR